MEETNSRKMTGTPPLTQGIGQAENALRAILNSLLGDTGTTYAQWVTLNVLARGESAVQQTQLIHQISSALKFDGSMVQATLGELKTLGLITILSGDPVRVELTTLGDTQVRCLRQRINSVTECLYGDLPMDELTTTHRILGIITERANIELGQL